MPCSCSIRRFLWGRITRPFSGFWRWFPCGRWAFEDCCRPWWKIRADGIPMSIPARSTAHEPTCMCYQSAPRNDSAACSLTQCTITKPTQLKFVNIVGSFLLVTVSVTLSRTYCKMLSGKKSLWLAFVSRPRFRDPQCWCAWKIILGWSWRPQECVSWEVSWGRDQRCGFSGRWGLLSTGTFMPGNMRILGTTRSCQIGSISISKIFTDDWCFLN